MKITPGRMAMFVVLVVCVAVTAYRLIEAMP